MLSKGKVKYIHSLEMKKYRNELNAFVAEGNKLVADMMFAFECELILAKPSWMAMQGNIPAKELLEAEGDDIRKASFLKNPQDVLAVFKRPDWSLDEADPSTSLVLALDGIQDPGNLGTIIRLADWFGIEHIVCSPRHRRCLQSEDCAGHNGRTGTCKSPLHGTGRLPESPGGKTNSVVRYIPRRRKHVHKGIVGKRNHRDGERRERNTSANRKVD